MTKKEYNALLREYPTKSAAARSLGITRQAFREREKAMVKPPSAITVAAQVQRERVRALARRGMTAPEIARQLGRRPQTIRMTALRAEIDLRKGLPGRPLEEKNKNRHSGA